MEKVMYARGLYLGLGLSIAFNISSAAAKEYFNPNLLTTEDSAVPKVDLTLFTKDEIPPGQYNVDVYINGEMVESKSISFQQFTESQKEGSATYVGSCLNLEQLKAWNIRVDTYFKNEDKNRQCVNLRAIPGLQENIDLTQQRFDLTIPQAALLRRASGYVSPERWDEGITAGLLNYSISGQQDLHNRNGIDSSNQFVSLQPGLNLGAWRFRNYSTYTHSHSGSEWDSVYSYVSRDIRALKSQMMLGQGTTQGGIFDSVSFSGVQLYSDNEMKPDSMQGFAPVVRGIAKSNAEVTVYQNNHSIYKATVPPGPFEFTDMYPTGSSGDLRVVIKESDGSQSSFIVPYASLPVLQRDGQLQYGLVAGKTRQDSGNDDEFSFVQGSAAWGAGHGITLYGGYIQAEDKYSNLIAGSGFNLGSIGALSLDISQSWADVPTDNNRADDQRRSGQSYRVRYSKTLQQTDTNISVAGYKFSTAGYLSFQDFLNSWNQFDNGSAVSRERNRFDVTVSQNMALGTLTLSLFNESYWNSERAKSINVGFSSAWGPVSWSLNYAHNNNISGYDADSNLEDANNYNNDNIFSLNLSVPFSAFSQSEAARSVSANYAMSSSKNGETTHNIGISGSAMHDHQLNWQVSEGYNATSKATNGNASVGYQSSYADMSVGYSYDDYSRRMNYSLRGGLVAHSDGITLSRQLNDSVALVETPGIADMPINGQTNVHTDMFGYAVVPYVRPYHNNSISLNTVDGEAVNAAIDNVDKAVVPTEGAVVRVRYNTWIGHQAMMTLSFNGKPVPFGAIVTQSNKVSDETRSSIVGQDGDVYLVGLEDKGHLKVKWGDDAMQQCVVDYSLSQAIKRGDVLFVKSLCKPVSGEQ